MSEKVELLMSERADSSPQSHAATTTSLHAPTAGGATHGSLSVPIGDSHPISSSTPLRKIKACMSFAQTVILYVCVCTYT